MGELNRSLSNKEKEFLQISVTETYNDFINHVSEARNMTPQKVDEIGQGRVWTGFRAKEIGLVDELGGLTDAITLASELAEIDDFKVLEFPKTKNGLENFFENIESAKQFKEKTIEELYLKEVKEKFLKMQGIQALLPIKYQID